MRRLALVLAVLLAVLVPALPAQAAGSLPQMTSFSGPTAPVDLEQVDGAHFLLHLTDDAGIVGGDAPPEAETPDVVSHLLINTSGAQGGYVTTGHLVAGTATDGDWDFGPFAQYAPDVTWVVNKIHLKSLDGDAVDLPSGFSFTTIGRYGAFPRAVTPSSSTESVVRYGAPLSITGYLSWYPTGSSTPRPVPGATMTFWEKVPSTPTFPDGDETLLGTAVTAADGHFAFQYTPRHNAFRVYFTAPKGTTPDGFRYMDALGWTGHVWSQVKLNHAPWPTTSRQDWLVPLDGGVVPNHVGQFVYLQRFTRTGWQTVQSARIRTSGRWTLIALPPFVGPNLFRVYKASDADHRGLKTAPFTITGT